MSKWIPVSERLPDSSGIVLTWDRFDYQFATYAIYDGGRDGVKKGNWYRMDDDGIYGLITVTHWMPLPEPPEAK